jgi:hypothetical protein
VAWVTSLVEFLRLYSRLGLAVKRAAHGVQRAVQLNIELRTANGSLKFVIESGWRKNNEQLDH